MSIFAINPNHRAYVHWLGVKEVPLFCIDDVYVDPEAVRNAAFEGSFPNSGAYYPGRHQPIESSDPDVHAFLSFMAGHIGRATGRDLSANRLATDFSIVTTEENQLLGTQGEPHVDGVPMLGVIYLNDADYGGTVFFRNKETGSMKNVTPEEKQQYEQMMDQISRSDIAGKYIVDDTDRWQVVERMEGRNNRLVMWPGAVFHSIDIKIPPNRGTLPEKRLTQRVMLNTA